MTPMAAYAEPRTDISPPLPWDQVREHQAENTRVLFVWMPPTREPERLNESRILKPSTGRTEALSSLPTEVDETLAELVALPEGWDGHGGLPVQPALAEQARRFMVAIRECTQIVPDIVPLPDGGLQLEWYVSTHEVEVAFPSDEAPYVYSERTADRYVEEFDLTHPLYITEIGPLFRALRR